MDSPRDIAAGIARLEGHLIRQAEIHNAQAEAEAFADRMPWLTDTQRDEIVRLYADARLDVSLRVLRQVTVRCHELRAEYTTRYEQLRLRLLCTCVALTLGAFSLCGCVVFLTVG
ncbi:hypothetical protein G3I60_07195 [Streptomyces sp. SID13666]|uniref:hypothetical protein n=1 Tax=unclassified Streptomyces TaxID=2593676 RepID=UPI0013C14AEE|nr:MULTISPECIES: hypothetical protein [unclassified Streptomyces]MCZ4097442.1 hypothetical protein [Streptomyces sp. H39-C1]NEA53946.1 hypothetical protein [Streptomyces sp. SID13666]